MIADQLPVVLGNCRSVVEHDFYTKPNLSKI